MTQKQLDIIKGVFYGQAIGDALGLGTEFLSKRDVSIHYPNRLTDYSQIIQDTHRRRWNIGDWSDGVQGGFLAGIHVVSSSRLRDGMEAFQTATCGERCDHENVHFGDVRILG